MKKLIDSISDIFPSGNEFLIDIGGARGNNTKKASEFISGEVVIIDPNVEPYYRIFKKKPQYLKKRFEEINISQWRGKKVVAMGLNWLQLFDYPDKKANLKKMKELVGPGGKIIIVDEVLRSGFDGWWDGKLNKLYNFRVPGLYIRLCLDGYRYLFMECELKILGEVNYNRGTYLWILEA